MAAKQSFLLSPTLAVVLQLAFLAAALPAGPGTDSTNAVPEINSAVEQLRLQCSNNDGIACIKFKFLNLLDQALKKDNFQVSDNVEVVKNEQPAPVVPTEKDEVNETTDPAGRGFLDQVEGYIKSHDMVVRLPRMIGGGRLTFSPRNLDADELSLKLKMDTESAVEGKGRKGKRLKKLLMPLMIFVLLKAMTLIPLALGVLGLKAWNALQLSFFSFLVSISLAIFQLCKKIATENAAIPSAHHTGAWEAYNQYAAARNFFMPQMRSDDVEAQEMAYNAYSQ